ncbi:MAG: hypothetical protein ACYDBB_02675 [Armatimonadota bacterium]
MSRSVKRYQNAAKLLPKALLQELQQYAAGKMLYVPYPITRREFNRLKVLDLRTQGYSLNQIAFRTGMTRQGVCRILRQDRQRALAIMNMLYPGCESEHDDNERDSNAGEMPPSRQTPSPRSEERE